MLGCGAQPFWAYGRHNRKLATIEGSIASLGSQCVSGLKAVAHARRLARTQRP